MAYGRNDRGRDWREDNASRGRWDEGRSARSRFEEDDRNDRGFFERAGDEIASWWGDEDAERRRRQDGARDWDDDRRPMSFGRDDDYNRQPRFRDEGYRRPYTGRFQGRTSYGDDDGPSRTYQSDRWDRGVTQRGPRQPGHGQRDFTGTASGMHDQHYGDLRRRHIDALDRDYDEYRRENQSRFEGEFSSWRDQRQTKRQMLKDIREQMTVVGSDDQHVGTVDKVRGDRVILTKNDSEDGKHHAISCSIIDRVEGDKVILDKSAEDARSALAKDNYDRDRALFERDDDRDRDGGPGILNRSFSGTY
jgi:hypothetical protein